MALLLSPWRYFQLFIKLNRTYQIITPYQNPTVTTRFSFSALVGRALVVAPRPPATMGRQELTEQEQDKNENARWRFANRN